MHFLYLQGSSVEPIELLYLAVDKNEFTVVQVSHPTVFCIFLTGRQSEPQKTDISVVERIRKGRQFLTYFIFIYIFSIKH